ncbi:MAG: hypothetical protein HZB20_11615 [Chloroflexi bacterium]|nr:hypothetical protein [Chloroflexota bacterium]
MQRRHNSLIATLGTKPQVVTTAADLLLAEGHALSEVVVLHTGSDAGPMAPALARLRAEFAAYPAYRSLSLSLQPVPHLDKPIPDIQSPAEAEAAFRAIYRAVLSAKRAERTAHLSIVGGRKVFAVYGMAAAQLLFDDDDCLWYVLAGGKFLAEERLHPEAGDEAKLVRVPVLRWGTISPVLTDLSEIDDPFAAAERQQEMQVRAALDEARSFVLGVMLTGAEQKAVELLVREGLGNAEIAERLTLSPRTVEHQIGEACAKASIHWDMPAVSRTQLVALLNLYYNLK